MEQIKRYDLKYELGPDNIYDQIAGEALEIGRKLRDLHLTQESYNLINLIKTCEYNTDSFYKVIVKAKEIKDYIDLIKKENISIEDYKIFDPNKYIVENPFLRLEMSKNRYKVSIGCYRFIYNTLTRKALVKVHKLMMDKIPELPDLNQFNNSLERLWRKNFYASYGNEEVTHKNSDGETTMQDYQRVHEDIEYRGQIFYYYLPEGFSEQEMTNLIKEIREIIHAEGLESKPSGINFQQELDNILRRSKGENQNQIYFKEAIKVDLGVEDTTKKFQYVMMTFLSYIQTNDVTPENYIEAIQKLSNAISLSDEEKRIVSKIVKAKKYFISRSKTEALKEEKEDINKFQKFLENLKLSPDYDYYRYKSKEEKLNNVAKEIKKNFPETQTYLVKNEGMEILYIKFPSVNGTYFFEVKSRFVGHSSRVDHRYFDIIAENL